MSLASLLHPWQSGSTMFRPRKARPGRKSWSFLGPSFFTSFPCGLLKNRPTAFILTQNQQKTRIYRIIKIQTVVVFSRSWEYDNGLFLCSNYPLTIYYDYYDYYGAAGLGGICLRSMMYLAILWKTTAAECPEESMPLGLSNLIIIRYWGLSAGKNPTKLCTVAVSE